MDYFATAILINDIEYFNGILIVKIKKGEIIKVDKTWTFAQYNGICFEIDEKEFKIFN